MLEWKTCLREMKERVKEIFDFVLGPDCKTTWVKELFTQKYDTLWEGWVTSSGWKNLSVLSWKTKAVNSLLYHWNDKCWASSLFHANMHLSIESLLSVLWDTAFTIQRSRTPKLQMYRTTEHGKHQMCTVSNFQTRTWWYTLFKLAGTST